MSKIPPQTAVSPGVPVFKLRRRVVKLHKFGPSHAITIPAEFCRELGAVRGNLMVLDLLDDAVIVRRQDEKPFRLKHALPKLGPGRGLGRD